MTISIVMTGTARSCTLTSGSNSIVVSSASGLVLGATIQGTGIPTGTRIASISGTTVTMENGSGSPVNATVGGAQSLIFSSVYGTTLTISMSASGDTANMDTIYNAGFGVKQRGIATREILFPGGLQLVWSNIVAGAVFDFQNWTIETGSTGYWQWEQSSIFGELRGGYLVNGTQFIKSAGPTFIANNFRNGAAGGTNMFSGTGTGTVTGTFRMNNLRVIYQVGSNSAPYFSCSRMNCIVDNMILDYQGGGGPNAGIAASFGTLNNTTIVKANSGIGNPNSGQYAAINGISYSGIFTDTPNHKFAIPNGYTLEGYAPQVLATQTLGAFSGGTTETYANIDLSTAGWGLEDLKAKYFRYGGPNTINFPRRVSFEFNDSTATNLTGVTLYIRSGSTSVVNAVQAGDYDANTQALVLTWTTTTSAYRIRDSFTDTIDQVAQVRKYGYIEQLTSYSLNLASYSQPFFMLSDSVLSTIDEATADSITSVSLDIPNKLIKITGTATLRQMYAKCKVELAKTANSNVTNFIVTDGDSANIFGGWTVDVASTGVLNTSTALKQMKVDSEQVTITTGGVVNIPYQDADGLRVTVTGLDPQSFGITWFLRHKPTLSSTWTNVSGTGNTALILLSDGAYDVQVRASGYEWESALSLDTSVSLSLNAGLRYHVSSNNTPQWTMSFDSTLANAFQYDAGEDKVSVENETSSIISPGFAELYRASQRIMHLPDLVWEWVAPVTANATSQKILIPTGNPINFYLTADSTNSVKITCPVIHADTGSSADDRVRGNAAGFSIILGSPATAESAGLQASITAALGGPNFSTADHGLSVISNDIALSKAVIDLIKTAADAIKAKTDFIPDEAVAKQSTVDSVKTKVDTLVNTDISSLATATNLADVKTVVDGIKTKTDTLVNTDISTLATSTNLAAVKTVVDSVKTKVDTLENTDISTLATATNLAAVKTKVDDIKTETAAIKTKVDTLENVDVSTLATATALASVKTVVDAVKTKVDTLENTDISTLATASVLSAVKTKVDSLENTDVSNLATASALTAVKEDTAAIKTKVDTLVNTDVSALATSTEVAAVGTKVDTAIADIEGVEVDIAAVANAVDAVDTALANAQTDITAIETKVDTLENTDISSLATAVALAEVKEGVDLSVALSA